jgi:hypothetical protein
MAGHREEQPESYEQLLRVGGVVPAIMIRVQPTDRPVSVQVTPTMPKGLAERLYENIGIECEASWVRDGWTMTSLKAIRVLPYQQANLLDAFRELAAASAGRWDGVDASAYLKELRSEEGEE